MGKSCRYPRKGNSSFTLILYQGEIWYSGIMLGKIFDRILHEKEAEDAQQKDIVDEVKKHKIDKKGLIIALVIFIVAFTTRAYTLFYITDPQNAGVEGWYSDTYHHWQIAYLSKEVGFKHGFLRLWDLKGMEYFWGATHPLVGAFLISLTGSTSIVVFRLLSVVMGSLMITVLFLIVRRHWGTQAGLAASLLGILNPVGMFSDASGMVEPLGIAGMLAGIYFFPRKPLAAGLFLALASMTRAEYWLLNGLVIVGILLVKAGSGKKALLLVGYIVPILLYMKYLLDWTGNPIYPIWWNFMGNAVGEWQANIPANAVQLAIQKVYWVIAGTSFLGLLATLWKRPKHTPFFLFGFGNWFMWGVVIGMTQYLLSYLPRFWVDRIMTWPYLFLGALIAIFIFGIVPKEMPKKLKILLSTAGWILVALIIFASQIAWKPIHRYYDPTYKSFENFKNIAAEIGEIDSGEGRILFPEMWPPLTYMVVHFEGVQGERIIGQMFDPFYYMEGEPFDNWGENREIVLDWLKKEDIQLMVFDRSRDRYFKLIEKEPAYFEAIEQDPSKVLYYYKVNQELLRSRS